MKTELINQMFETHNARVVVMEGIDGGEKGLFLINLDGNPQYRIGDWVWREKDGAVIYYPGEDTDDVFFPICGKINDIHHDFNKNTISLEFDFNWC